MAFDACMMRAVLNELTSEFPEAKIEKVLQPSADEIDLVIHYHKTSRRLLFNVGPSAPRIQLTDIVKENPMQAPMFCMFLRKRLIGAKIVSVEQPGFDRIARLRLSGYDEMGYPTEMSIVCEIMGKYANFILLDSDDKIISAMKMIDFAASTVRQILPGLRYTLPAMQDKLSPFVIDREAYLSAYDKFPRERTAEKFITAAYSGVAAQIARELVYRSAGSIDVPLLNIDKEKLYSVISAWQELLINHSYKPTLAINRDGLPADYSYMEITYLGNSAECRGFDNFASLFDEYFCERDRLERIHRRASDINRLLSNAVTRIEKKLALQHQTLLDCEHAEEYRRTADLITSNLYQIPKGATKISVIDYYDENCPSVEITLDGRLSASANAQKLYKQYNKAKTAKAVLSEQILRWEEELRYLESVRVFLDNAEREADIIDIRDELYHGGYGSRMKSYAPRRAAKSAPISMKTSGGYTLLVGRNNIENDRLTFKTADKGDLWFHVKDMPGSHVILITDGKEPSERDYTEACEIAAGYSSARGDNIAVDYTRVKNVKKPSGAKPGYVIYHTNYTAYVTPRKRLD